MSAYQVGTRREVCWDESLMDQVQGVRVKMHRPEFRNVVLDCNKPWEGDVSGYFSLIHDEGQYRLYYRGADMGLDNDGNWNDHHKPTFCYAVSQDGKHFERPSVGIEPFWGSMDNNIIKTGIRDNMFYFKDTNPACPPEEKYKALAEHCLSPDEPKALYLFTSGDGVHFVLNRMLANDGAYDSLNIAFWDETTEQYYLFFRGIHGEGSTDGKWGKGEGKARHTRVIRDVRVKTSKDFVNWSERQMLDFGPEADDYELYTNAVQKYYRAKHMFIGFPTRYVDRYQDVQNFAALPNWKRRQAMISKSGRGGTAMTDCAIMTSRDGLHFRRTDEVFLSPGAENGANWYYGDGYLCYGMVETASDIPGAPNEISIYAGTGYRCHPVKLTRYAVRLDGFFSWHCDYKPGKVVTKPVVFGGNSLSINFATSAIGYVQIRILDAEGNAIEGYDSGKLFGDSVDRTVDFEKKLADLAGQEVRLEISMSDAELYSFKFEEIPAII